MAAALKKQSDLTTGPIVQKIALFAVPVILGNMFQQLYNTTSAVIVGQMIGTEAFAAISVANPIMSVLLFFLVGICMGVSVLLSQQYGAHNTKVFQAQFSTALIGGSVFTVVLSVVFAALARPILIWNNTPAELLEPATIYLSITTGFMLFPFLYNYFANALRAIGDATMSFVFLVVSSVLNIVFTIALVYAGLGVAGAAIANVVSQFVSALLTAVYMHKKVEMLSLSRKNMVFDKSLLKQTISFSWVSAMQQTVLYLGRMLMQGSVNRLGTDVIAGYNAALRIEAFFFAVSDGFSAALSTFAGQNKGAGQPVRVNKGFLYTVGLTAGFAVLFGVVFFAFARPFVSIFLPNPQETVLGAGQSYLQIMAFFYIICGTMAIFQSFFRGLGLLRITMVATFSQITIRVVLAMVLVPFYGVVGICMAVIAGWSAVLLYEVICLKWYYKTNPLHA
ncbi:MAG: MATE family efflux transporter [Oscillospiraceae bacterium]